MADEKNPYVRETAVSAWVRQVIDSVNTLKLEPGIAAAAVAAAQSAQSAEANTIAARDDTIAARDTAAGHAGTASTAAITSTDAATTATGAASTSTGAAATAEAARDVTLAALILGAGRPDIPGTLSAGIATQVAAATTGAEFRSTNGPQGAWVWMKRATGWVCVDGNTGPVVFTLTASATVQSGAIILTRVGNTVTCYLAAVLLVAGTGSCPIWGGIPNGFRVRITERSIQAIGLENSVTACQMVSAYTGSSLYWVFEQGVPSNRVLRPSTGLQGTLTWSTPDPWPSILP